MNREVHVRFWERAEVQFLRATRHSRPIPLPRHVGLAFDSDERADLSRRYLL